MQKDVHYETINILNSSMMSSMSSYNTILHAESCKLWLYYNEKIRLVHF